MRQYAVGRAEAVVYQKIRREEAAKRLKPEASRCMVEDCKGLLKAVVSMTVGRTSEMCTWSEATFG